MCVDTVDTRSTCGTSGTGESLCGGGGVVWCVRTMVGSRGRGEAGQHTIPL